MTDTPGPGLSEGLDLSNLDNISPEEINANLARVWSWRGPLYEMYANSLMLDYAPDLAKLHRGCWVATERETGLKNRAHVGRPGASGKPEAGGRSLIRTRLGENRGHESPRSLLGGIRL
jgi:hypothetical protein